MSARLADSGIAATLGGWLTLCLLRKELKTKVA